MKIMRSNPLPTLVLAAVALALPIGCGDDGYVLAPVSGRVLVDGEPVAGLRISFEPIGGADRPVPGPESIAVTEDDGGFRLYTTDTERRGAVVGPCRVRIWSLPADQPEVITDDQDPNYDSVAEIKAIKAQIRNPRKAKKPLGIVPFRFNDESELTFTVPPEGTTQADFEISWK